MSNYEPLTEETAMDYVRNIPGIGFHGNAELHCEQIGDGLSHSIFRIVDQAGGKKLIVKQAIQHRQASGPSGPSPFERSRIESQALRIGEKLCPALVPNIVHDDHELALIVMEDIRDHSTMLTALLQDHRYSEFASQMSDYLTQMLFFTSDFGMDQQEKKWQQGRFINPECCKVTESLLFDEPYMNTGNHRFDASVQEDMEQLWSHADLHAEVAILREKFLTHTQSLIHGNLHPGNIIFTPNNLKILNPDFAFYGPMAFDVGTVIAHLLLMHVTQFDALNHTKTLSDDRDYLLETVQQVWHMFINKFRLLWEQHCTDRMFRSTLYIDSFLDRLLQDAVGFAGCEMIRRVLDNDEYASKGIVFIIGTSLTLNHRFTSSIEEMIAVVKEASDVQELTKRSGFTEFEA